MIAGIEPRAVALTPDVVVEVPDAGHFGGY